jgi:type IV pilus biogenesis protein CpaD/CtpE
VRLLVLLVLLAVALAVLLGCAHRRGRAVATPTSAPTGRWVVTHETSMGVDFGNGVIQSTTDTTRTYTPDVVQVVVDGTQRGGKDTHQVTKVALPPDQAAAIEAAIPGVLAVCGNYALSPNVPDEGWASETLGIQVGDKVCSMDLSGGGNKPSAPDVVRKFLGLLIVRPPPPNKG